MSFEDYSAEMKASQERARLEREQRPAREREARLSQWAGECAVELVRRRLEREKEVFCAAWFAEHDPVPASGLVETEQEAYDRCADEDKAAGTRAGSRAIWAKAWAIKDAQKR